MTSMMARAKRIPESSGISKLAPIVPGREYKQHRQALAHGVLKEVMLAALTQRNPADLMLEIYLAGLWHGAEIGRKRA